MTNWLSVALKNDLKQLITKIRLPDYSDSKDYERRKRVVEIAATLPGLRMCERRRLIFLAQSAPPVDLATLAETLTQLDNTFDELWLTIESNHEVFLNRCRIHLVELDTFADMLMSVYTRRDEANRILDSLEVTSSNVTINQSDIVSVYPYSGYEVEIFLPTLRAIKLPDMLIQKKPKRKRWDDF